MNRPRLNRPRLNRSRLNRSRLSLLALVLLATISPASGQTQQTDKPFDFRPLLPPLMPVPPNSAVTSGSVGGARDPYTTAPLQNPTPAPTQTAPGMRLTIPTR